MGGFQCFGAIDPDPDAPLFHADWERRVLALTLAMGATGEWNLDESRFARESLPPVFYLSAGYYRVWLAALEQLVLNHGLLNAQELAKGQVLVPARAVRRVLSRDAVAGALRAGSPVSRDASQAALFSAGQRVRVRNRHSSSHTRLPGYLRGHVGTITRVHGCHVYPDAHAAGEGENPQWLYNVQFDATELWGAQAAGTDRVHVDCWQPYLEAVGAAGCVDDPG